MWFAATDGTLNSQDPTYETEVDAEILGGCVMAFTIITPLILLAYALEGTEVVQATSLDSLFCFTAAATLIATGSKCLLKYICFSIIWNWLFLQGMSCFAWNNANVNNTNNTRRTYEAAGALGLTCIGTGVLYMIDFFWVMYKKAYLGDPYEY